MRKLASTVDLPREEWLALRKNGIGGSDAGAISGLNPYVSPMHVYLEKTSDYCEDDDNEAMRQGRDLENYVAERFMEETGLKVRRCNYMIGSEEPGYEFMYANVDRMIVGENAGLECKTASAFYGSNWKEGKIPPHYLCQCYHYMAVTGADAWYLAVVVLGKDFRYFKVERDEGVIDNLKAIERRFWDNVKTLTPPNPDGSDATEEYFRQRYSQSDPEKSIVLGSEYTEKLKRYEEISDLMKKLDQEKKKIEEETKAVMDTAELGVADGFLVSWKAYETERLDTKTLKAERPDIYKDYSKTTSVLRSMNENLMGWDAEEGSADMNGHMFVLSNSRKTYGAAGILINRLLRSMGRDLFILPSSVHETIIVPVEEGMNEDDLDQMIREVNGSQLDPQDILSDHAYFFDYKEDRLKLRAAA